MIIMSKFSKKISKVHKELKDILVVGSAFGNIEDLLETCSTVFISHPKDENLRRKNLVYRESLDSIHLLHNIDFIIIDQDLINVIPTLERVWKKWSSALVIEGSTDTSMPYNKFLKLNRYQIVDIQKHYHVWKLK
jgi:hypothetical protein